MAPLLDRLRPHFPHAVPDGPGARLVLALARGATAVRVGLRLRPLSSGTRSAVAVQSVVGASPGGPPPPGLARDGDDLVHRSLVWEPAEAEALADHLQRVASEVAAARAALETRAALDEIFVAYCE